MKADFRVFVDANVLADITVCDLLLSLAERPRQLVVLWSEAVLAEVERVHRDRLNWPEDLVKYFQGEVRRAFPDAIVKGYEPLLSAVQNDPKDHHVLAAAIQGQASAILTFNLKDFPEEALAPWGIQAAHPQDYLLTLYDMDEKQVVSRIGVIAGRKGEEAEDVLLRLGRPLPAFAARLLEDLNLD